MKTFLIKNQNTFILLGLICIFFISSEASLWAQSSSSNISSSVALQKIQQESAPIIQIIKLLSILFIIGGMCYCIYQFIFNQQVAKNMLISVLAAIAIYSVMTAL